MAGDHGAPAIRCVTGSCAYGHVDPAAGQRDEIYQCRVLRLWFMISQVSNVSLLAAGPLAERFGLNPPLYEFCGLASVVLERSGCGGEEGVWGHFSANG